MTTLSPTPRTKKAEERWQGVHQGDEIQGRICDMEENKKKTVTNYI
jgi:hypothetical protein